MEGERGWERGKINEREREEDRERGPNTANGKMTYC